jgi:hypothetical protein
VIEEEDIKPIELKDTVSIQNYVINICEQMIDISKEMEEVRREYDQVTAYLNDIHIVEGIGGEQKAQLVDISTQVAKLINTRNEYLNAEKKISDETFNQMQEDENEIPAIIRRLRENENYLETIKRDLNRIAAEKIEYNVLRHEREEEQKSLHKTSKILLALFGVSAIALLGLSIAMDWNALPMFILAFLATLIGTYVFVRMQDCAKDIKRCDVNQNYAIALENRVKIRYVNTKNAIDYTCNRFRVNNSRELIYNYEQYQEVCKEREKLKNVNEDLDYFNNRLVRILRGLNLYDAKIWLNYANAVIDPREMVELKHDYFNRRASLRARIEYNVTAIDEMRRDVDLYLTRLGDKGEQVRAILQKVDELNKGYR